MSYPVWIDPAAVREIDRLAEHIAQHSLDGALALYDAVERICSLLADTPHLGAEREFARLKGVRMVPLPGFASALVYYRISDRIEILHVVHGARDQDQAVGTD